MNEGPTLREAKRRRGKMQVEEAKILLGFPPKSRPDPSQVSSFYPIHVLCELFRELSDH